MSRDWGLIVDTLSAFQSVVRLNSANGWTLHSWNYFTEVCGGGRISPYTEHMVASLWFKESERKEGQQ